MALRSGQRGASMMRLPSMLLNGGPMCFPRQHPSPSQSRPQHSHCGFHCVFPMSYTPLWYTQTSQSRSYTLLQPFRIHTRASTFSPTILVALASSRLKIATKSFSSFVITFEDIMFLILHSSNSKNIVFCKYLGSTILIKDFKYCVGFPSERYFFAYITLITASLFLNGLSNVTIS